MNHPNPFAQLGIEPGSGKAEITAAFRKLAKGCHPDLYPGDPLAAQRFRKLEAAKQAALAAAASGDGKREGRTASAARPMRRDVRRQVEVGVRQAYGGCTLSLDATSGQCPGCSGEGHVRSRFVLSCETCSGTGISGYKEKGIMRVRTSCPDCGGSGRTTRIRCAECGGRGTVRGAPAEVTIPPGTSDGDTFTVPGAADDPEEGITGNLEVVVRVVPEDGFRPSGKDVEADLEIDVWDAALGATRSVPGPDGRRYRLTVPPGSRPGRRFRMKGEKRETGFLPDFVVILSVRIPDASSGKARAAYERLREEMGG